MNALFDPFGRRSARPLPARLALAAAGALLLSSCATQQEQVAQREDYLAAAGFAVQPANTPEREQMLRRLPPFRFVLRARGDAVHYVYADPLVCGCLYVGTQAQYNLYKRDRMQRQMLDEQQMTAATYSDASWNWSAWGPWGAQYGFAYGPGIGW